MKKTTKDALKVGAGVATVAAIAAAAVTYLLSGEEGEQRKEKAKAWLKDARQEIVDNIKTARKMGEVEYDSLVDEVLKKYGSLEDVSMRDIIQAGRELKAAWKKIQSNAENTTQARPRKTKPVITTKKRRVKRTS